MAIDPHSDPHAHIVRKPLPSQVAKGAAVSGGASAGASAGAVTGGSSAKLARREAAKASNDPFIRAENEDDDGYDPYSDRPPAPEPMFQEDPWA